MNNVGPTNIKQESEDPLKLSNDLIKEVKSKTKHRKKPKPPKPKNNFISFFKSKSLFSNTKNNEKANCKLIKFYQNGRLNHGKDVIPTFELPGHSSFELNRHEFTLPHASKYKLEKQLAKKLAKRLAKKKCRKVLESSSPPKFTCDKCGKSFANKNQLTQHIQSKHENMRYVCDICNRSFSWEKDLRRHVKQVHEDNVQYNCEKCDKSFHYKVNLSRHIQHVHENVRYNCDKCDKSFLFNQV